MRAGIGPPRPRHHLRAAQENLGHATGADHPVRPCAFRATYGILCGVASQKLGMVCCSSTCKTQGLARARAQDAAARAHAGSGGGGSALRRRRSLPPATMYACGRRDGERKWSVLARLRGWGAAERQGEDGMPWDACLAPCLPALFTATATHIRGTPPAHASSMCVAAKER
jgi:hypothetical protein